MKLTKETLKRIIREELEEARKASKPLTPEEVINHPWMKHYLDAYFGSGVNHDWFNAPVGSGITQSGLNEKELFNIIKTRIAGNNEQLTLQVVKKMMDEGILDEEFLLAAGIK